MTMSNPSHRDGASVESPLPPEQRLTIAREAAATLADEAGNERVAEMYRRGAHDKGQTIEVALRAIDLDREARAEEEKTAHEQAASIKAEFEVDPCDCKIGDCKRSRMFCLENRKRQNRKDAAAALDQAFTRSGVTVEELPDDIRVPLHELQADAGYLFGRVASDGSVVGMMTVSVRTKLDALEAAILAALSRQSAEAAAIDPTLERIAPQAGGRASVPETPISGDVEAETRLWWYLTVLNGMGGNAYAGDEKWNWLNTFCNDRAEDPDTYNLAERRKLTRTTHDVDTSDSVVYLTPAGRAWLAERPTTPQPRPDAEGQGVVVPAALEGVSERTAEASSHCDCCEKWFAHTHLMEWGESLCGACMESAVEATPPAPDAIRQPAEDDAPVCYVCDQPIGAEPFHTHPLEGHVHERCCSGEDAAIRQPAGDRVTVEEIANVLSDFNRSEGGDGTYLQAPTTTIARLVVATLSRRIADPATLSVGREG